MDHKPETVPIATLSGLASLTEGSLTVKVLS